MQVVIKSNGQVVDYSADDVEWTLEPGMRIEHMPDTYTWEHDPWNYVWVDGAPVYVAPPPEPYFPAEAIAILMRGNVTDAEAVRLKPYLPAYDASREYAEGELAVRYGRVARRTSAGWRELG